MHDKNRLGENENQHLSSSSVDSIWMFSFPQSMGTKWTSETEESVHFSDRRASVRPG